MGIVELTLIAIGLSMDAFAVSLCQGLNMKKLNYKDSLVISTFFGTFQALMPLVGWFIGVQFERYIVAFDHWIAFFLLAFIGVKMIFDAFKQEENQVQELSVKELFLLAIATSIDALVVGITFALIPNANIYLSVLFIGIITFILSFIGVLIGHRFGDKYEKKAELFGGFILIAIGLKILIEHLSNH